MTIYSDSTYDGWCDEVDSGGIGEYMMGATQRHDLPGSLTPSAPYSAGHEVRGHRYESLEELKRESRSSDPQELLDLDGVGTKRRRELDPGLEAKRLTAIDLGVPMGFVEGVINGSVLAGTPEGGCGDPRQLSSRVMSRFEAHLRWISRAGRAPIAGSLHFSALGELEPPRS
ncbi:MAG: hypothetical protein IPG03_01805 [Candidatus Microthrix sp.]|nr:hypothetical protein [Candidatus Microthrix sp.]MBK6501132.1 hypothetical protein [Candidatus Microthrix sp.]